jgi:hypothetical protein
MLQKRDQHLGLVKCPNNRRQHCPEPALLLVHVLGEMAPQAWGQIEQPLVEQIRSDMKHRLRAIEAGPDQEHIVNRQRPRCGSRADRSDLRHPVPLG